MEGTVIEDNLDKECHALGGLFLHIVNEMKVSKISVIRTFLIFNVVKYDYLFEF